MTEPGWWKHRHPHRYHMQAQFTRRRRQLGDLVQRNGGVAVAAGVAVVGWGLFLRLFLIERRKHSSARCRPAEPPQQER